MVDEARARWNLIKVSCPVIKVSCPNAVIPGVIDAPARAPGAREAQGLEEVFGCGQTPTCLSLIDGIYDAAVDGNQWTTALNKLARAARADASSIVVQDRV